MGASLLRRRSRHGARPQRAGGAARVGGVRDRDRRASRAPPPRVGGWLNAPGATVTPFDNPLVALHGVDRVLGGLRVAGLDLVHLVFPVTLAPDFSGPAVAVTGVSSTRDSGVECCSWVGRWRRRSGAVRNLALPGRPAALVGAVWVLVSALLVMNLVFTLGTVLADRVLYWPSAGWCLMLAALRRVLPRSRAGPGRQGASPGRARSAPPGAPAAGGRRVRVAPGRALRGLRCARGGLSSRLARRHRALRGLGARRAACPARVVQPRSQLSGRGAHRRRDPLVRARGGSLARLRGELGPACDRLHAGRSMGGCAGAARRVAPPESERHRVPHERGRALAQHRPRGGREGALPGDHAT